MLQSVKRQIKIQRYNILWSLGLTAIGGIIGMILMQVMIRAGDEGDSYFTMGTAIAILMMGAYILFMEMAQINLYFNTQISLGSTRKEFYLSAIVTNFLIVLLNILLLLGINRLETLLLMKSFPAMENEVEMFPWLIRLGLPIGILLSLAGTLGGILLLRYGRKAFWIMWVIWMVGCLFLPRIGEITEEAPDSFLGVIVGSIQKGIVMIPGSAWGILGVAAAILLLGISWGFIRKQQVQL